MTRFSLALAACGCLLAWLPPSAAASEPSSFWSALFPRGPDALRYGPYTGGHGYSWNVAYGYGFAFSAADTWRRDPFAYPAGIYPYRPYGRPIYHQVFPKTGEPFISVPGCDGLPVLVRPGAPPAAVVEEVPQAQVGPLAPVAPPVLQPVPQAAAAHIRVLAPEGAEVWVEKEKLAQTVGAERLYQTPPLAAGQVQVYSVKAKWLEGGREVEQFRVVGVKAGETARLTFGR